ncbi:MAG: UvrD-helicase domain-containing protein [bacterium]
MDNIAVKKLNREQRRAVTAGGGPLLIVAGAGTGKTTVITQRFAWLLKNKKLEPKNILAVTFTEKAAGEMEERIDQLLPLGYSDLWIHTFHGFADRVLRSHALEIGLDPFYKVLTQSDQWLFLRKHIFDFNIDYYRPLGNPTKFLQEIIKHISRAKDENVTPADYKKYANTKHKDKDGEEIKRLKEIAHIYAKYQQKMAKAGFLDFGDLIMYTMKLFKKRPNILKEYQQQFKYILVDEFQDTNWAQYAMMKMMARPENNLTVVGDDDQAIFRFRGASVSNILQFEKDFPKAKKVVMLQNYRSTQEILDLAYKSIQFNNPDRLEEKYGINKKLQAQKKDEKSVNWIHKKTMEQEAVAVVEEIIKLNKKQKSWNKFCILVRANATADVFLAALSKNNIPYQFLASRGLYQRSEIIDIMSYLRVLADFYDNINLLRVLSIEVFDIHISDITKIIHYAKKKNIPLIDVLLNIDKYLKLSSETNQKVNKVTNLIEEHSNLAKNRPASEILVHFLEDSGYMKDLRSQDTPENDEIILNIGQFFKQVQEYQLTGNTFLVRDFIAEVDLAIEGGEDPAPVVPMEGPEAVKIMTIHAAKGLEFPVVFVASVVEERFPVRRRSDLIPLPNDFVKEILPEGDEHLEEERRLFYVACTRAKEKLYFTTAEDYGGKRSKKISRFLSEISKPLTKFVKEVPPKLSPKEKEEALGFIKPEAAVIVKRTGTKFEIPKKFSYSQIRDFNDCPLRYKFKYLLKIPQRGSQVFSYGQSLHGTLRKFHEQIKLGKQPKEEDLHKYLNQEWVGDWYSSRAHERKRKKEAKDTLKKYYQDNKSNFKKPVYLEKGFSVKINKTSFSGFIDRVDDLGKGKVEIIDYKTGSMPKAKADIEQAKRQLYIYGLAMKEVFKLQPEKVTLYYLDKGEQISDSLLPERMKIEMKELVTTTKEIKKSKFNPTPGYMICKYCDFRDICEARHR